MESIRVDYDPQNDVISQRSGSAAEPWLAVCQRYDDDVHRIRGVNGRLPYTGLYACYDIDNRPSYYLVEEDASLRAVKKRVFFSKLGREVETPS